MKSIRRPGGRGGRHLLRRHFLIVLLVVGVVCMGSLQLLSGVLLSRPPQPILPHAGVERDSKAARAHSDHAGGRLDAVDDADDAAAVSPKARSALEALQRDVRLGSAQGEGGDGDAATPERTPEATAATSPPPQLGGQEGLTRRTLRSAADRAAAIDRAVADEVRPDTPPYASQRKLIPSLKSMVAALAAEDAAAAVEAAGSDHTAEGSPNATRFVGVYPVGVVRPRPDAGLAVCDASAGETAASDGDDGGDSADGVQAAARLMQFLILRSPRSIAELISSVVPLEEAPPQPQLEGEKASLHEGNPQGVSDREAMSVVWPLLSPMGPRRLRAVAAAARAFAGPSTAPPVRVHVIATTAYRCAPDTELLGPALAGTLLEEHEGPFADPHVHGGLKQWAHTAAKLRKKTGAVFVRINHTTRRGEATADTSRLALRIPSADAGRGAVLVTFSVVVARVPERPFVAPALMAGAHRHWWSLVPLALDEVAAEVGARQRGPTVDSAHRTLLLGPGTVPLHAAFGRNIATAFELASAAQWSSRTGPTAAGAIGAAAPAILDSSESIVAAAVAESIAAQEGALPPGTSPTDVCASAALHRTVLTCRLVAPAADAEEEQVFARPSHHWKSPLDVTESESEALRGYEIVSDGLSVVRGKGGEPVLHHDLAGFAASDARQGFGGLPRRVALPSPFCIGGTTAALVEAAAGIASASVVLRKGSLRLMPIALAAEAHHRRWQGGEYIDVPFEDGAADGAGGDDDESVAGALRHMSRVRARPDPRSLGLHLESQHKAFLDFVLRLLYGPSGPTGRPTAPDGKTDAVSRAVLHRAASFPLRVFAVSDSPLAARGIPLPDLGALGATVPLASTGRAGVLALPPALGSALYWQHLCEQDPRGCHWLHAFWHRGPVNGSIPPEKDAWSHFAADVAVGRPYPQLARDYLSLLAGRLLAVQQAWKPMRSQANAPGRTFGDSEAAALDVLSAPSQLSAVGHHYDVSLTWESFCVPCFGFTTELMHFLRPLEGLLAVQTPHKADECFCEGLPASFDLALRRIARGGTGDGGEAGGLLRADTPAKERAALAAYEWRPWERDYDAAGARVRTTITIQGGPADGAPPLDEAAQPAAAVRSALRVYISHKDPGSWPRRSSLQPSGPGIGGSPDIIVGRAMFEATTLPGNWRQSAGEVDEVWVPTRFSRYVFEKEGFDARKLVVIPEPIDVYFYSPHTVRPLLLPQALAAAEWQHAGNRPPAPSEGGSLLAAIQSDLATLQKHREYHGDDPMLNKGAGLSVSQTMRDLSSNYKFLSVFKWEERKAWRVLVEAFCTAFTAADPVSLYLVTYRYGDGARSPSLIVGDIAAHVKRLGYQWPLGVPHIEVISERVTEGEMVALYRSADAFVLPTRGEGWGLPVIQALAMALPTIATGWSGIVDFAPPDTAVLLPVGKEDLQAVQSGSGLGAGNPKLGPMQWAAPRPEVLRGAMRRLFDHPEEGEAMGRRARAHIVNHFSDEAVAEMVKARLRFLREEHWARRRKQHLDTKVREAMREHDQAFVV